MAITSIKEILTTINILDVTQKNSGSRGRHPANEFQSYAYKLANDLRDLEHLQIYMRLAKTIDRSLMERAYSFASDSTSNEKGRIFMWKLKQIRGEIQKRRDSKNYDYDFVIKKMSKVRDKMHEDIRKKSDNEFTQEYELMLSKIIDSISSNAVKAKIQKVLVIGNTSEKLIDFLIQHGTVVYALDISRNMTKHMKRFCEVGYKKSQFKIITKDFLKNNFKESYFDFVFLNNFWQLLPFDTELKFLKGIQNSLKTHGKVVLNFKQSVEIKEEWKSLIYKNEEVDYFIKYTSKSKVKEALEKVEFTIDKEYNLDNNNYFLLTKLP